MKQKEPEYITGKHFGKIDFRDAALVKAEYEDCSFTGCNFTGVNLSGFVFADTEFIDCNLSLISLVNTSLRTVRFIGCKMIGLVFHDANAFALSLQFENTSLNHCSFYKLK